MGAVAPLFAFIGVVLVVFIKKQSVRYYGQIIAGLGILFIGMDMMSSSMAPLRESEAFVNLLTPVSNPVLGILAGAIFTAIIQSSSASVGILQALASSVGDWPVQCGVCVVRVRTSALALRRCWPLWAPAATAKRTTIIHLMFNIIGTILFTIVCIFTPLTDLVSTGLPHNPSAQIANMHTLF